MRMLYGNSASSEKPRHLSVHRREGAGSISFFQHSCDPLPATDDGPLTTDYILNAFAIPARIR
jgi:hypothetical protein